MSIDTTKIRSFSIHGFTGCPKLKRQLFRAMVFALSCAPKESSLSLHGFQLSHKQFWRVTFAIRQFVCFTTNNCKLMDIKTIDKAVRIDQLNMVMMSICKVSLISSDNYTSKYDSGKAVIKTIYEILRNIPNKGRIMTLIIADFITDRKTIKTEFKSSKLTA